MLLELSKFLLWFALIESSLTLWNRASPEILKKRLIFLTCSFGLVLLALMMSSLSHDFSVQYIREHTSRSLDPLYLIAAVWAGHQGSTLLFLFFASLGTTYLVYKLTLPKPILQLACFHLVMFGIFCCTVASPFQRHLPFPPLDGHDLNPLLRDQALSYHPPLLLFGTALFFPIALVGLSDSTTPYRATMYNKLLYFALGTLTLGITFGSMWAYHVLGWGGFWFWDPVETISIIPWFGGLLMLHHDPKKIHPLTALCIWLAILLGLLLVRSNLIVSVHAFAQTQSTSLGLLTIIVLTLLAALKIYSLKKTSSPLKPSPRFIARIFFLLILGIIITGLVMPILVGYYSKTHFDLSGSYYNHTIGPLLLCGLSFWAFYTHFGLLQSLSIAVIILLTSIIFSSNMLIFLSLLVLCIYFLQPKTRSMLSHSCALLVFILLLLHSIFKYDKEYRIAPDNQNAAIKLLNHSIIEKHPITTQHYLFDVEVNHGMRVLLKARHELIKHQDELLEVTPITFNPGLWNEYGLCFGPSYPNGDWCLYLYFRPLIRLIWFLSLIFGFAYIAIGITEPFKKLNYKD